MSVNSANSGEGNEIIVADFNSENMNISFNSKYLIDIASEVEDKKLKNWFHKEIKLTCDKHGKNYYRKFKKNCDQYNKCVIKKIDSELNNQIKNKILKKAAIYQKELKENRKKNSVEKKYPGSNE